MAAIAVAVCVLAYQWTGSAPRAVPDSVFPVRQALHFAGHDTDIDARTTELVCRATIPRAVDRTPERMAACRQEADAAAALPAQHRRLFQMQPGFAIVAAPFVAALGEHGVAATAFLIGVACGLLCLFAFRAFGVGDVRALLAEALFLASPGGSAAIHLDGHGAALLGVLAALGGVGLLVRAGVGAGPVRGGGRFGWPSDRRTAVGLACVGVGVVWALVARFADGLAFAVCLVVALGVAAVSRDAARRVRCLVAGFLTVVIVLLWAAIAYLVGLPSVRDAVLDGVTDHFRRPTPADPLGVLLTGDRLLLSGWAHGPHLQGLLLLGLCAAAGALIVRFRTGALLWAVPAVAAAVVVLARPVAGAAVAHGVLMWLPLALGLALLIDVGGLRRSSERRRGDDEGTDAGGWPGGADVGGGSGGPRGDDGFGSPGVVGAGTPGR